MSVAAQLLRAGEELCPLSKAARGPFKAAPSFQFTAFTSVNQSHGFDPKS